MTFGGPNADRYVARNCSLAPGGKGNAFVECTTPEGVGAGHTFRVVVAGAAVMTTSVVASYLPPAVSSIDGATGMSTRGGATVQIDGDNFGSGEDAIGVTYAVPEHTPVYDMVGCVVVVPHTRLRCSSAPGVGRWHTFNAFVGGQTSVSVALQACSYLAPEVHGVRELNGGSLDTLGGSLVDIVGAHFGPAGPHVISATYGPSGVELSAPCALTAPHLSVRCVAGAGAGAGHVWRLLVAAQPSAAASAARTAYAMPALAPAQGGVSGPGATNGSTKGGEFVFVRGRNFGPTLLPGSLSRRFAVTYGPAGVECAARASICIARIVRARCTHACPHGRCQVRREGLRRRGARRPDHVRLGPRHGPQPLLAPQPGAGSRMRECIPSFV